MGAWTIGALGPTGTAALNSGTGGTQAGAATASSSWSTTCPGLGAASTSIWPRASDGSATITIAGLAGRW